MSRKTLALSLVIAVTAITPVVSSAAPPIVPGGPWVTDTQQVQIKGFRDYDQLTQKLEKLVATSKGRVELSIIGRSNPGVDGQVRNVYLAKVGDGLTPVLIMAQQHGDEIHGSEAALHVLQLLSTGSKRAKAILEELTVLVIPRVNPDGFEIDYDGAGSQLAQRENDDPCAPARDTSNGFYTQGVCRDRKDINKCEVTDWPECRGWDINRFHYLDWMTSPVFKCCGTDFPDNPVPEAQAVVDAYVAYRPRWVLDVHNQFTYRTEAGKNVTGSVLWPLSAEASPDAVALSKQMAVILMDHMKQFGYAEVTRFPSTSGYAGIARNAYGIAGSGSLLAEIKGQEEIGQKQKGMLIRHITQMIMSLLEATADGSLFAADPERVAELPERGDRFSKDLPASGGE